MYQLLLAGGWLMLPLAVCSVLILTISLEKLYQLHLMSLGPKTAELAIQQTKQQLVKSPLGRIYLAAVNESATPNVRPKKIRQALLQAGALEVHRLESRLNLLGTLTSIAPLLGLLGTVVGMIDIFTQLDLTQNNPQALAGGIGVALITTATGLSLAIPALIAHRHFIRRLDTLVLQLETTSQDIFNHLASQLLAKKSAPKLTKLAKSDEV